ncbi:hypothetical protein ACFQL1_06600 [Halomicroarcula sp. GCM10025709]|uniref:hypothetical protein n=1 Tax=Halomicroarcula sp. GCM10025709 TaxID=3252669 RepID=UPI003620B78A
MYSLLYAVSALVGFQHGSSVPTVTLYLLLGTLFVFPTALVLRHNTPISINVALLIATPLLPALLVVDPLEVGFYGYDPYRTLQTTVEFREHGPLWIAGKRASWPAFYALVWIIKFLTGGEISSFGRFLPLFTLIVPTMLYAFARKLIDDDSAFLVAMGLVGVRTLFTFEIKFIDESLAFVLFFALLLSLRLIASDGRPAKYLCYLFATATVLAHHYIGFLTVFLLVLWDLTDSDKLQTVMKQKKIPFSGITALSGGLFVGMFLVIAPSFCFV